MTILILQARNSYAAHFVQWRIQDLVKGEMRVSGGLQFPSRVWGGALAAGAFFLF